MSWSVHVPFDTLESIPLKYGLKTIDFLELDSEGYELEALRVARLLFVKQYGFTFYRLVLGCHWLKLKDYSKSLECFTWLNILPSAPGVEPASKGTR